MSRANNAGIGLAVAVALGPLCARAVDFSDVDLASDLRAAPQASLSNEDSPFSPASSMDGIGRERARGEADLRVRYRGLFTQVSGRVTSYRDETHTSKAVLNQLYYELEALGCHATVGKKVVSWDVGFGFRPLDVIQQEDRRYLVPFALEGVPLLALERFGASDAWTLVYANPLRSRAPEPRDEESAAVRYYRRVGAFDLHGLGRWSRRTQFEVGGAFSAVVSDILELHASFLYQRRLERLVHSLAESPQDSLLSSSDPAVFQISHDALSGLVGATLTPGLNFSILAEGWFDPSANTGAEWHAMARLARQQRALLDEPSIPREAVLGNLAYGARFFDRPNLLRQNVLLRVSWKWDRFEPAMEVLYTPEDGGWVASAAAIWEGERSKIEIGGRAFGGRRDAAYSLFPERGSLYASGRLRF